MWEGCEKACSFLPTSENGTRVKSYFILLHLLGCSLPMAMRLLTWGYFSFHCSRDVTYRILSAICIGAASVSSCEMSVAFRQPHIWSEGAKKHKHLLKNCRGPNHWPGLSPATGIWKRGQLCLIEIPLPIPGAQAPGPKDNSCSPKSKLTPNLFNPLLHWAGFSSDFVNLVPSSYLLKALVLPWIPTDSVLSILTRGLLQQPPFVEGFYFILSLFVALAFRDWMTTQADCFCNMSLILCILWFCGFSWLVTDIH